ncbi:hypothetical protein HMPREF9714_03315 [Myroides odoratimimus CCUG 12901]|uniref:hypothetical protein n=1 Tax=Myroides odoratimimus TaxID=76832 RepID=UPI0002460F59|nr:hypothetical protein [Myroides odoratimimus]EHO05377.1 hypothetical protein HMPREF9714_03315 [Myroides odoratimimus CCUG 12901]
METTSCFDIWDYSLYHDQLKHFTSDFIKGNIDLIAILNSLEFTNTEGENPDSGVYSNPEHDYLYGYVQTDMLYIELTELNKNLLSPLFNNINIYSEMFPGWTGENNIDLLKVIKISPDLGYGVVHYNESGFYISGPDLYVCSTHYIDFPDYVSPWMFVNPTLGYHYYEEGPSELPF